VQQFVDAVEAIDFAELVFENALVVFAMHHADARGQVIFGRPGSDTIFECLLLIAGQCGWPTRTWRIDQAVTVIAFDPSSNGALIIAGELGNFCASQQLLRHRDSLDTPGDPGTRLTSGRLGAVDRYSDGVGQSWRASLLMG